MKKIVIIASVLTAVVTLIGTFTACCLSLTSEEKAAAKQEIKSALAKAGTVAYNTAGRAKLESFLAEQVAAGKLTETQKTEALVAADKGAEALTAYLESASKSTTATSGTGTTSTTAPTATDTSGGGK